MRFVTPAVTQAVTSDVRFVAAPHDNSLTRKSCRARQALAVLAMATVATLAACSKPAPAPEPVRSVKVMAVGETGVQSAYEFSGTVAARAESRLGFRVGGKISKRLVEVGQRVKAGELLAQLDPQDLALAASAARSQVSAAQTQADLAQADFKRFKDLRDQGFISTAELDRREAALKAATATLDQARAQLSVQGNQAGYAALVAPTAGVIVGVDAEAGQVVGAGTPVIRLAADGARDAVFSVPEQQLKLIKVGDSVKLRLPAEEDRALTGKVREIGASADPATRTFPVKVQIEGASPPIGATAYILPASLSGQGATALKLPTSALRETAAGKSAVWLLDKTSMTVQSKDVQVITADANDAVLEPGSLGAGQWVVTAGVHVLQPGQKVTVFNASPEPEASMKKQALPSKESASVATKIVAQ
jgi:membrane fusion protein, multidrug efflux system